LLSFSENHGFCILATDRQTDGQTDKGQTDGQTGGQTDKQMDSSDALSRSRYRERRLNNSKMVQDITHNFIHQSSSIYKIEKKQTLD